MTLLNHLLGVFAKPAIHATLRLGPARPHTGDRKAVARALHSEVTALFSKGRRSEGAAASSGQREPMLAI
jgi:hypothetical protein